MLELLDVRGNNLTGTIPTEIGHMLSLKHLWVLCNFMHILMSKALKSPYQVSLSSDCFARINFKKVYRLSLESYACYLIFNMTKIFHQMRRLELVAQIEKLVNGKRLYHLQPCHDTLVFWDNLCNFLMKYVYLLLLFSFMVWTWVYVSISSCRFNHFFLMSLQIFYTGCLFAL